MNALPSSLEIFGKTIYGEFRKNITLNASKNTKGIDILWARRKIDRLTDIHNNAFTRSLLELSKKDIVELALDYHLVSKFTSLVAVDITPIRPETEELVTQAIIKKAKAEGLEDQIKLNEDGKLQNRDELMLALIKALPEHMVVDASAQKQFEMALKSANVPALAYNSMKVPEQIAFLIQPTYIAPSQTATSSELLMYLGLILFLIAFMLRRRLLA
jgi:hypothetical protein